jgi:hypothetical protein
VSFYAMVATGATSGGSTVNNLPAGQVCTDNGAGDCSTAARTSGNAAVSTATLVAAKAFSPAGRSRKARSPA